MIFNKNKSERKTQVSTEHIRPEIQKIFDNIEKFEYIIPGIRGFHEYYKYKNISLFEDYLTDYVYVRVGENSIEINKAEARLFLDYFKLKSKNYFKEKEKLVLKEINKTFEKE